MSMNLVLAMVAQCGDNNRLRRQGIMGSGAVFDRVHAWSDHGRQRCATREAEKGKVGKAVSNAVPPAHPRMDSQNMAA